MTPNQQRVLEAVPSQLDPPQFAYEIAALANEGTPNQMPYWMVYNAITFLCDKGLVARNYQKYQITEAGQSALRDLQARETVTK